MTTVNSTETKIEYKEDAITSFKYVEDDIDALSRLASQLNAMLMAITGEGFESFDGLNESLKENYLWACSDKARELNEVAGRMALDQSFNHKKQ